MRAVGPAGHHDDRRGFRLRPVAKRLDELVAVHLGHLEVRNDHVERRGGGFAQPFLAVGGRMNLVSRPLQHAPDVSPDTQGVVDQENSWILLLTFPLHLAGHILDQGVLTFRVNGERQAHGELRAEARLGFNVDLSVQVGDGTLHHVHADAPPRLIVDFIRR